MVAIDSSQSPCAVALAHAHAAQALRRDVQSAESTVHVNHAFDATAVTTRGGRLHRRGRAARPRAESPAAELVPRSATSPSATRRASGPRRARRSHATRRSARRRRRTAAPRSATLGSRPPIEQGHLHQPQRLARGRVHLAVPDAAAVRCTSTSPAPTPPHAPGVVLVPQPPRHDPADDRRRRGARASRTRARRDTVLVDADERAVGDVVGVVVRAGREAVPGLDAVVRAAEPVVGAADHASTAVVGRPREQVVDGPGVDDRVPGRRRISTAFSQPFVCQSSWPGACASVSMENKQPASTACSQQPVRRIEPFRARVDLDRDTELGAGGEDDLGVEVRLADECRARPSPCVRCSGRGRRCAGSRSRRSCAASSRARACAASSARSPRRGRGVQAGTVSGRACRPR